MVVSQKSKDQVNVSLENYFSDHLYVKMCYSKLRQNPSYISSPNLDNIIAKYENAVVEKDSLPKEASELLAKRLYDDAFDFDKKLLRNYTIQKNDGKLPGKNWNMDSLLGSENIHKITNNQNVILDFGMDTDALIAVCGLSGACRVNGKVVFPNEISNNIARKFLDYEHLSHTVLIRYGTIDNYSRMSDEMEEKKKKGTLPFTLFRSYNPEAQLKIRPKLLEQLI